MNTSSTQHPAVVNHQQLNLPNAPYVPPELTGDVDDDEPVAAPEMPPPQGELQDDDDDEPAPVLPAPVAVPAGPALKHSAWAVSASSFSSELSALSTSCAGLSFHHSRGLWRFRTGSRVPMPIGLGALGGGVSGGAHPRSFADAMCRDNAAEWKTAALAELDAHKTNGTWILVPRPKDRPVIGSKWIFTQKYCADGSFERYKGRLVAQGFSQHPVKRLTEAAQSPM